MSDDLLSTLLPNAAPESLPARLREISRYVLLEEVGAGAMGVVYRAHDPDLGRMVAIKVVHARSGAAPTTRLVREAQAIAQVAHPNIVAIHDVGTVGDQVFLTMELVDGQRLRDWMNAGPRTVREIIEVFAQAGRGLAAAHDAGLVHRDFKPENVLVGIDGRVRVVDFGLVRWAEGDDEPTTGEAPRLALDQSLTPAGGAVGTPRYMSPEQVGAHPVGPASDQFSFCVCLYEALAGQRPFAGDNLADLLLAIALGAVRPWPRSCIAPRWLRELVLRGLSTEPAARWPSMSALVDELTRERERDRRAALDGLAAMEPMIAAFPPPDDVQVARRVDALRAQLEKAWELKSRGALASALRIVAEVGGEIDQLGYRPLRAAWLYLRGNLQYRSGEAIGARATLLEAAREAARAGDDWQVANAWTFLVLVVGLGLGRFDEAEGVVAAAEVALERVGENASLRSRLLNNWGACLLARGRALDAAASFAKAVELDTITHGAGHGFVAVSLLHLAEALIAAQRLPEAAATLDRAWAVCQPERLAASPTRLRCFALLGRLRLAEGRAAEAVPLIDRAIAGWERMTGRERALGEALRDLAAAWRTLGRSVDADASARRSSALLAVAAPRTA